MAFATAVGSAVLEVPAFWPVEVSNDVVPESAVVILATPSDACEVIGWEGGSDDVAVNVGPPWVDC